MREASVEKHLHKRVRAAGGDTRKVRWIGRRGAPDRLVMFPERQFYLVETKAPGGKLKPHQAREHARLRAFGWRVLVLSSKAEVDKFMERTE